MQGIMPLVDISDILRLQWPLFAVFGGPKTLNHDLSAGRKARHIGHG